MTNTRRKVSESLDVFSQNPGAILVRTENGWSALERPGPGYRLIVNTEGEVVWKEGIGTVGEDSDWIDLTPDSPWYLREGSGDFLRRRKLANGWTIVQGLVFTDSQGREDPITTMPLDWRPNRRFVNAGQSGGSIHLFEVHATGDVTPYAGASKFNKFHIAYPADQ